MYLKTMKMDRLRTVLALAVAVVVTVAMVLGADSASANFGIEGFDQQITAGPAGGVFTQAGGHPYEIITEIELNHHEQTLFGTKIQMPDADARDIVTKLPPGLFGNPTGIEQCTIEQLSGANEPLHTSHYAECPIASQVGYIELHIPLAELFGRPAAVAQLYNIVPAFDQPAAFGFDVAGQSIILTGNVRNGGDFGINVISPKIPDALPITGIKVVFWGVPGDPRHDFQRCQYSLAHEEGETGPPRCGSATEEHPLAGPSKDPEAPRAFLTLPVSCTAIGSGVQTTLQTDAWSAPGVFAEQSMFSHEPPGYPLAPSEWGAQIGTTGCPIVPFKPAVDIEPSTQQADTPAGLNIDFSLPQEGLLAPEGIATSDVRKTVVTLPAGVSVSPSAADGLGACTLAQIGLGSGETPSCPDSAKMGTVEIDTPLLSEPLHGAIYLAKQNENPFHSLIALYLVAEGHGVVLKLAGQVNLDPVTGQLQSTFDNSPELPFNDLKIDFKGGPRAPLVTPHECGTYTSTATMTPWSGNAPATVSSSFEITSGPGGKPCPSPRQFAPGFTMGTTSIQAGGFSPLTMTMSRPDGDEQLGGVSLKTPPGLLGTLSTVALCGEPRAAQGTCGPESQIGTVVAAAGAGANPFYVNGGKVFITQSYHGAPFGLSVVVPAVAGPFDLGTVVVRGTIAVDPHTAALTITTDPLPTILDGIPLDIRVVNVNIDRPGFVFNSTNCEPQAITGTLSGGLGDTESVGAHYQVTNCASLGFKPVFKVATNGHTSRANGASLHVSLLYPKAPFGTQANIAKVHIELPKALPSRLSTLNHACLDSVFNQNPASCPSQSRVGFAKAVTPVLPVPLEGPAYFVSHGGQKFPELIVVLQGYGVTVDLQGETFISKAGITSSTFKTVPDVPVGSFELTLPEGPFSALAANTDLCTANLVMPNTFDAQNGAQIKQNTPIEVQGCQYSLRIVHRAVKRRTLTVKVSVPAAGRLVASGKGVSKAAKTAKGRSTLTLTLEEGHAGKLRTKVQLRFTPSGAAGKQRGKQAKILRKSLTVTFG